MKYLTTPLALAAAAILLTACSKSAPDEQSSTTSDTHTHADGTTHGGHAADTHADAEDHAHDEVELGTFDIGGMQVELAQGHGNVAAGKEGHLVVKLPYNDQGATRVRAWIGTRDSTLSMVGMGEYAPSHDDYDVHAVAPTPLPADTMWWLEIEKPDGTRVVGSAPPLMDAGAAGSPDSGDAADHDHAHDEVSLGTIDIGGMQVELAQGHGAVAAGKEGHLVVRLPYNDRGTTVVRAWIGSADRTLSMVGVGEYAPSHDDYDIHAVAPTPLPAGAKWWIEIEKPDGTKVTGSASPIM